MAKKAATSKETLVQSAREIAYREGIGKLSIRRLAAENGVAIGTVYNYFPSKADLVAEVLADFWKQVFHGSMDSFRREHFPDTVEALFGSMKQNLQVFRQEFLADLAQLEREEKEKSREMERHYQEHMKQGLLALLEQDGDILPEIWTEQFTKEGLISFVFSNLMMQLRSEDGTCCFLKEALERLLYKK